MDQATQRTSPVPMSFKLTPDQHVAFEALRRQQHLSRTQFLEKAIDAYFRVHGQQWPAAKRRNS